MSDKYLVIVESPTKAKTIRKYLGKDYKVLASNGHIRDLPNSAVGVNVDENFEPLYIIPKAKKDHVKELKAALKEADFLYLATDEDREGESISWHLVEALKPKIPMKRLVFHEITKDAIKKSIDSARDIDINMVRAQETRRIVDRLFGYSVSPLLWKKMGPRLSAGRVQSVAIRLLVDRERARIAFHKAAYWGIKAQFAPTDGKRIAIGKDFNPDTGELKDGADVALLSGDRAAEIKALVESGKAQVSKVDEKPYTTKPPAPFVTSTIQQEANRKLRFAARRTMSIAQQLYENGFITYMRTDSTTLSSEAVSAARNFIKESYGDDYLPKDARVYSTKVKNAQEAHEAIRPAGESFTPPEKVKAKLGVEAFKLYELIWMRTVASQMKDAKGTHISVHIAADKANFRASGKTVSFPGFLRAYVEGSDDPEAELADKERILPAMSAGTDLDTKSVDATEHSTQPPARFTEGSIIKELERLGIGRPSTWASIVELVLSRQYAFKKGSALVPTFTAMAVVRLLEQHFTNVVDYDFTAALENDLDSIARGEAENKKYLSDFYFGDGKAGLHPLVKKGEESIDPRIVCGIPLGTTEDGREIEVRIGKWGPFLSDGEKRASVTDETAPDELSIPMAVELLEAANREPESLGLHPETGEAVYLKAGPYGPYVQLGEGNKEEKIKPKMASLLSNMTPEAMDFETALKLLSLPRDLGEHPELKNPIIAANGRFGPYIKCDKETRSIPLDELSPLDMTLEDGIALLAKPKKGRGGARKPKIVREMGKHPVSEKELTIRDGRYGPYVTDGDINASLPKGTLPEELSMELAVDLIEARAAKAPKKRATRKKKKK
ncbi:UNVERIFIED_CONTAM: hypothetical protein GTU68_007962 [Idotea baltica]|nr:hypothetical protein [Idotea baltica]